MGVKLAVLAAALVATAPLQHGVSFLQSRQLGDGSFAEAGRPGYPQLTAWTALGLRAAGSGPRARAATAEYLVAHESELSTASDLALAALAEKALDESPNRLLARQGRTGGWGWTAGAPDSNDTASVIEALRASGVRGRPIQRALGFLLRYRNRDGGFELTPGRGSDAQSTAWAIQAFLAAGKAPPRGALAYLKRLQRPDGSFRYSARYATTPVWVTAQVLPALARKPFPLR